MTASGELPSFIISVTSPLTIAQWPNEHSPTGSFEQPPHQHASFLVTSRTSFENTCSCERGSSTCWAKARPGASRSPSTRSVAVAASAGSLAAAKLNARSGNSAIAVPIARIPNPNHSQLTSGLT